jgi:hypothetical protein
MFHVHFHNCVGLAFEADVVGGSRHDQVQTVAGPRVRWRVGDRLCYFVRRGLRKRLQTIGRTNSKRILLRRR